MSLIKELSNYKIRNYLEPYSILFVYSTSLLVFLTENQLNLLQVAVLALVSVRNIGKLKCGRSELCLFGFISCLLISILYTGIFKMTSFVYTCCFIISFLVLKSYIDNGKISLRHFTLIIKFIFYSYAIVLFIQQISYLLGLPVFNGGWAVYDRGSCNSLANECSHTSRIIILLAISYIYLQEISTGKKYTLSRLLKEDRRFFLVFSYLELTTVSGTGVICFILFFFFFIKPKNVLIIAGIMGGFYVLIQNVDIPAFSRIRALIDVIFSLDTDAIRLADNSASARINPYIYYVEDFNISSIKTWLGYGYGYSQPMLIERVIGYPTEYTSGAGGVYPVLFYDYGLIAGLAFMNILFKFCFRRKTFFYLILWLIIFASTDLNTYMQWLFISVTYAVNFFYYSKDSLRKIKV